MNDGNLLIFGCAVCLSAIAVAYAYLRDDFSSELRPLEIKSNDNSVTRRVVGVRSGSETHP
jgi:hypothetical protein